MSLLERMRIVVEQYTEALSDEEAGLTAAQRKYLEECTAAHGEKHAWWQVSYKYGGMRPYLGQLIAEQKGYAQKILREAEAMAEGGE